LHPRAREEAIHCDAPEVRLFDGQIVPYAEAKVGILTHASTTERALSPGSGPTGTRRQEQLYVFRAIDHFRRLKNSGKLICAEIDYTPEDLVEITLELLRREGYREDCYIRR